MTAPLHLTAEECELIVGLLEQELQELPVEIHHSRNAQLRGELVARREWVRVILDKLHAVATPA
jgi:hypothetical protein